MLSFVRLEGGEGTGGASQREEDMLSSTKKILWGFPARRGYYRLLQVASSSLSDYRTFCAITLFTIMKGFQQVMNMSHRVPRQMIGK